MSRLVILGVVVSTGSNHTFLERSGGDGDVTAEYFGERMRAKIAQPEKSRHGDRVCFTNNR